MVKEAFLGALRSAVRDPVLTGCSVILLALGMGSFATGSAVVSQVVLDPTPFSDAPRLVRIWGSAAGQRFRHGISGLEARALAGLAGFKAAGAFAGHSSAVESGAGHEEQVVSASVTSGLLAALRARPVAGRVLTSADDQIGAELQPGSSLPGAELELGAPRFGGSVSWRSEAEPR